MVTRNSSGQDYTNNTDGFTLGGGTTARKLTVTGADVTLNGSGSNTYTFPSSSDTLVGTDATQTLTHKTLDATNTFPTLNQDTTGNAATATKLQAARTIQTDLASTSAVPFDGSANVTPGITGTLPVNHGGTGAATLTGIVKGNGTSAMTAVTAPSGAIVGTTDTQNLTHKTLDNTNTVSADALIDGTTNHAFTAADDTKLAGIEAGADVTDTANVDAAGAVMNSDTSTAGMSFVVDEDNMASNSNTKVPTQQSVKAYVDANVPDLTDLGITATAAELNVLDGITATTAELNYTHGVTSNIQTQLDAKVPTSRTVNGSALSANITLTQDNIGDGTTYKQYSATEKSKLAGIEASADVTDATNVDAAGAVMNSDTSTAAMSFVVDEDNMASNSNTKVPTQQSTKAYVDSSVSGKENTITAGTTAQYWRGDKSWQTLNKAAVGLGSVDNTSDATKNVLSATKLTTARAIGGVNFDGTANINLPGVNTAGNQDTSGNAATATYATSAGSATYSTYATQLQTTRSIGGVNFNGTANINLPGVNTTGNQNTTGSAASLTTARSLQVNLGSTSAQTFNGTANATSIGVSGTLPVSALGTGAVTGSNNGTATSLTLWTGTLAQYNSLGSYSSSTVYVITS